MDTKLSVYICLLGIIRLANAIIGYQRFEASGYISERRGRFFFTLFTDRIVAGQWIVTITVGPGLYFVFFL